MKGVNKLIKKIRFYFRRTKIFLKDSGVPCRQKWRRLTKAFEKERKALGL